MISPTRFATERRTEIARSVALVAFVGWSLAKAPSVEGALVTVVVWSIAALGLGLVLGLADQPALCHGAFMLAGAYGYAIVTSPVQGGGPPVLGLLVGTGSGAVLAALLSPVLRLRGVSFAICTIAAGLLIHQLLVVGEWLPGGDLGIVDAPPLGIGRWQIVSERAVLVAGTVVLVSAFAVLAWVFGRGERRRSLRVIAQDEVLLAAFGGRPHARKQVVFVVSGALAALAGVFWVSAFGVVQPTSFGTTDSFLLATAVVIGGRGKLTGALVGTAVLELTATTLGPDHASLKPALIGVVVIAAVRWFPDGLAPSFGLSEWLGRRVGRRARGRVGRADESAAHVTGAELVEPPSPMRLEVTAGRREIGSVVALDSVDLAVPAGVLGALIGPNGAGKSTLLESIAGVPLTSGVVLLDGADVTGLPDWARSRRGVARTFQHVRLIDDMSVIDNVRIGVDARARRGGRRGVDLDETARTAAALDALGAVGLAERAVEPVGSLGLRDRRLIELVRVLAARPSLALLDEPSSGLDQADADRVATVIRLLHATPCTVLLVEHDLAFVSALAEQVDGLVDGRVVVTGTLDEVLDRGDFRAAYLGGAA